MENIQVNGQRIWGPPRDWTGPPPPHGTEIYIKNLPDDVYEMELFQIFSVIGRVYEVRLPVHWSGVNRGYAFVRYTKISEADAAIKAFSSFEIRIGRMIQIERSVDNTRLFLSCVPSYMSSEDIMRDLQGVVDNIENVYVYPTLENPAVFRGYAFVEFKSHRDAAIAKRILTPDVCFNLFEKRCVAAWANPLPFLNNNILKTINILFMRNMPKEVKCSTVKRAIENILGDNSVQRVKRLNNFAFVTFKSHESAKKALNLIKCHPSLLGSNQIQVEWAVPRELNTNCDDNLEDCDIKKANITLPKQKCDVKDFVKNDMVNMENDTYFNTLSTTQSENIRPISRSQNTFRKILKRSREKLKGHCSQGEQPKEPDSYNAKCTVLEPSLELLAPADSHSTFQDIPELGSAYGAWNMTPNSYLESEESCRSPQLKPWFGNFVYSSCSSSPALTVSSAESPVYWANDDICGESGLGSNLDYPQIESLRISTDTTKNDISQFGKTI